MSISKLFDVLVSFLPKNRSHDPEIHKTIMNNDYEKTKRLVCQIDDVYKRDRNNYTILHYAIVFRKYKSALAILDLFPGFIGFLEEEGVCYFLDEEINTSHFNEYDESTFEHLKGNLFEIGTLFDRLVNDVYLVCECNGNESADRINLIKSFIAMGYEPTLESLAAIGDHDSLHKAIYDAKIFDGDIKKEGLFYMNILGPTLLCAIGSRNYDIVKYLLGLGVPATSSSGPNNNTNALMVAVEYNDERIIDALLEYGADPMQKNYSWRSPLIDAECSNNEDLVMKLKSHIKTV